MAEGGNLDGAAAEVELLLESPTSGLHRMLSDTGYQQGDDSCSEAGGASNRSHHHHHPTHHHQDPYKMLERSQSDASLLRKVSGNVGGVRFNISGCYDEQ